MALAAVAAAVVAVLPAPGLAQASAAETPTCLAACNTARPDCPPRPHRGSSQKRCTTKRSRSSAEKERRNTKAQKTKNKTHVQGERKRQPGREKSKERDQA